MRQRRSPRPTHLLHHPVPRRSPAAAVVVAAAAEDLEPNPLERRSSPCKEANESNVAYQPCGGAMGEHAVVEGVDVAFAWPVRDEEVSARQKSATRAKRPFQSCGVKQLMRPFAMSMMNWQREREIGGEESPSVGEERAGART